MPWACFEQLAPHDLFFVETPIDIDDLDGYAFLGEHSPIRIAAGEWQNTHWEFLDLADRGKLDVLQPDVGRVGGFSEARKVLRIAEDRGAADRAPLLEEHDRHRRQRPPGGCDDGLSRTSSFCRPSLPSRHCAASWCTASTSLSMDRSNWTTRRVWGSSSTRTRWRAIAVS